MRTNHVISRIVLASLLATAAVACGGDDDDTTQPAAATGAGDAAELSPAAAPKPFADTFVGELEGTDAYLAIAFDGEKAWAYVCDGTGGDTGELANYLTGSHHDGAVDVADDEGVALTATVDGDAASGTVTLIDGSTASFALRRATGEAAWLSATVVSEAKVETGSWIRLTDGSVRGKVVAVDQAAGGTSPGEPDQLGDGGSPPPAAEPTGAIGCFLANRKVYKMAKPKNEADQILLDAAVIERNRACT